MSNGTFTIETEQLLLRELRESDADDIAEIICDPETMLYFPSPFRRQEVLPWIERNIARYREKGCGLWAVILKTDGRFAGDCGLVWQDVDGVPELEVAFHFKRSLWGNGYATDAARACLNYGFEKMGQKRIISLIRLENRPSARIAVRNGMRIEKQTMRAGLVHNVYVIDYLVSAIRRSI